MKCPVPAETPAWRRIYDEALKHATFYSMKTYVASHEVILATVGSPHERIIRSWYFGTLRGD